MAIAVVMPRLGWGGEEGSLVEWIKQDGEAVKPGEIICTVEGDKAVNEVESLDAGILRIPPDAPQPGAKVPVGTVLAYLVQSGEAAPFETAVTAPAPAAIAEESAAPSIIASPSPAAPIGAGGRSTRRGTPPISPRAKRTASELGVEWEGLSGSGSSGRIVERDVRRAAADRAVQRPEVRVSPLARRLAIETGVDLEALAQAIPGRQITRADVEAAAAGSSEPTPLPPLDDTAPRIPFRGVRRLTAERLSQSARTTVPVTLTTDADATALVRLREQIKVDLAETDQPLPSYNDLIAKLVALALQEHPALNASLDGEEIIQHPRINLGLAVDTERGLLVPVLPEVDRKSVGQIAAESAQLIARARAGKATAEDLRGGTFTLSNLGMYEIDAFTPVINLPEVAILGIGRITAQAVVVDEEAERIAVRKIMALSLTFDHRLVDGAPAARFLQRVRNLIARPTLALLR